MFPRREKDKGGRTPLEGLWDGSEVTFKLKHSFHEDGYFYTEIVTGPKFRD